MLPSPSSPVSITIIGSLTVFVDGGVFTSAGASVIGLTVVPDCVLVLSVLTVAVGLVIGSGVNPPGLSTEPGFVFIGATLVTPLGSGFVAAGFVAAGFVTAGLIAVGLVAAGFVAVGFVTAGLVAVGFVTVDFVVVGFVAVSGLVAVVELAIVDDTAVAVGVVVDGVA